MTVARLSWLGLAAIAAGIAIARLVPVKLTNPLPRGDFSAPPEIQATLKRACYDCHSNETRWPWYSRVAPFSWLIVHDVTLGRKEINFSEWAAYYPATRRRKLEWMGRALREEQMPPWLYLSMHPGARLTKGDRVALEQWIALSLDPAPR